MQDAAVLNQLLLGYSPLLDRERKVVALRLTVFPDRPDATPAGAALLQALQTVWPAGEGGAVSLKLDPRPLDPRKPAGRAASGVRPAVSLNLAGEGLLRSVLAAQPGPQLMIEVPAFMAADPSLAADLRRVHAEGSVLLIKGRPTAPLPAEVLALFSHAIVESAEDQRIDPAPQPGARNITFVRAGARSPAEIDTAFQQGAVAVLGWPWDDTPQPPRPPGVRNAVASDVGAVMELIQGVDQALPVPQLEAVLRRDPTLAFRLMRYLNSPAFGLSVEVNSFGHALMLLGYQRLKRWLALLLAPSGKGPQAPAAMYAAVRRGLLMEELGRDQGLGADSSEVRGEMFICGVFSLLDRLLQQPMSDLLPSVPVPERVQQALRGEGDPAGGGPYAPYLALVKAIEHESLYDMRELSESLMLGAGAVNRALLRALLAARQLDG